MEPTKTSFFQALNIPTKITKGSVEIVNDFVLLQPGQKVSASEAALLQMLNILPFNYSLRCRDIYDDGTVYSPDVLDTSSGDMLKLLQDAISNVACISLAANFPTQPSVPSHILNGLKDILALTVATAYTFPAVEKLKDAIKNPGKFAVAKVEEKKPEKKEEKKVEKKRRKKRREKRRIWRGNRIWTFWK
jgi:large subunit ribosomal protein LP0